MSEQMSARELSGTICEQCHSKAAVWFDQDACEALILADRKATVEKVIAVLEMHTAYDPHGQAKENGASDGIIHCTDAFRSALDGVLVDGYGPEKG